MELETTYKIKGCARNTITGNTIRRLTDDACDSPERAKELYEELMERIDGHATQAFLMGLKHGDQLKEGE